MQNHYIQWWFYTQTQHEPSYYPSTRRNCLSNLSSSSLTVSVFPSLLLSDENCVLNVLLEGNPVGWCLSGQFGMRAVFKMRTALAQGCITDKDWEQIVIHDGATGEWMSLPSYLQRTWTLKSVDGDAPCKCMSGWKQKKC